MADGLIRRQMTEDRGQRSGRGYAAHTQQTERSGDNKLSPAFCLLTSVFCLLSSAPCGAENLPDPTRLPPAIAAPVQILGEEDVKAGLQAIFISGPRRAAIIDGETVELGGKYGDAKLIKVNEGSIVLQGAEGRQEMTLFPGVNMTRKKEKTAKAALSVTKSAAGAGKGK